MTKTDNGQRTTYTYDAANRLLEERAIVGGASQSYSGMIEAITRYEYDANGNTLKAKKTGQIDEEVVEYRYNEQGQLVEYINGANQATSYGYDGTGMRIAKTENGKTVNYYWDRGYIANECRPGEDAEPLYTSNYLGVDGIFARQQGESVQYLMKNGHGDVTAIVEDGAVIKTYDYDAFGTEKNIDPSDTNPIRYCGEYFDAESGQLQLRNRYYNSSIGRFMTEDPIRDGLNWYVYCGNNPVIFLDPTGTHNIKNVIGNEVVNVQWNLRYLLKLSNGLLKWDDGVSGRLNIRALNHYGSVNYDIFNSQFIDEHMHLTVGQYFERLGMSYTYDTAKVEVTAFNELNMRFDYAISETLKGQLISTLTAGLGEAISELFGTAAAGIAGIGVDFIDNFTINVHSNTDILTKGTFTITTYTAEGISMMEIIGTSGGANSNSVEVLKVIDYSVTDNNYVAATFNGWELP